MTRTATITAAFLVAALAPALARDEHFAAGAPGNPKQPARTVTVVMGEAGGAMKFTPDRLDVKKGEQVRFLLENKGALPHEFRLATVEDNDEHAAMMQRRGPSKPKRCAMTSFGVLGG